MAAIHPRRLINVSLRWPDGKVRARAVLPLFTPRLDVRQLLVLLADGRLVLTADLPAGVGRRGLEYGFEPALHRELSSVSPRELDSLLHFDPWWVVRDREDLPPALKAAVVHSNIAGHALPQGTLDLVQYDDGLDTVVAGRVRRGLRRSRLGRDELRAALD